MKPYVRYYYRAIRTECVGAGVPLESRDVGASAGDPIEAGVTGLCAQCLQARVIRSDRGSKFYLCKVSATDPRFPKYPSLPVWSCPRFEASEKGDSTLSRHLAEV
jgi:hypothetical protein